MIDDSIAVSIVIYKTDIHVLSRCIESVLKSDLVRWLGVIDNSPSDEVKKLCNRDKIDYVVNRDNIGYGAGHNIAIRKTISQRIKYHLVVNPDIYFSKGTIESLYEYMESGSDVGLVMPKVLYPDGSLQKLCKLLPTPSRLFARRFLPFLAKKWDSDYQLEFADYNACFECPSLSGCFMFLRTDALKLVGLFDERFFMYFEDVDLVRRIGQHFKTVYWPGASITHHYAKGSYVSRKLLFLHLMSAIKYFNKWGWFWDSHRKKINRQTLLRITKQK